MVAALWARDGRLMHGTTAIAKAAGLCLNAAAKGIDDLQRSGFLTLLEPARQQRPTVYSLTRPPRAWDPQTPTGVGGCDAPDPHGRASRPPRKRSQTPTGVGPHGEHGEHVGAERVDSRSSASAGPTFALRDGSTWTLDAVARDRLAAAHPGADLDRELAKAALWCDANPAKRKTARGMLRFLAGWLGRVRPGERHPGPDDLGISEAEADAMLAAGMENPHG